MAYTDNASLCLGLPSGGLKQEMHNQNQVKQIHSQECTRLRAIAKCGYLLSGVRYSANDGMYI
jgi:hypothetical protein